MQTTKQAAVTAAKINQIRRSAGNPLATCPTCGNAVAHPYSRVLGGVRVEGCIDSSHVDHLPNGYAQWFFRREANELRKATLTRLVQS
jgi:hypothetical protein